MTNAVDLVERSPCAFTPGGADESFCQTQSVLVSRNQKCNGCQSVWRICQQCAREGLVKGKESVAVNPISGLCARHGGIAATPEEFVGHAVRDQEITQLQVTGDEVLAIPVAKIRPRADQPRQYFDVVELEALADGMKIVGQQQPAIVVPIEKDKEGHEYELDDGERRWRAVQLAGIATLNCVVIKSHVDSGLRFLRSAVANFNRSNHTLLEEVDMVIRLVDQEKLSQQAIAKALGRHPVWVNQRYALRRLHTKVRAMLEHTQPREHRLSFHAALRLSVMHPGMQADIAPSMVGAGLHQHGVIIGNFAHGGRHQVTKKRAPRDDFRSVQRAVQTALGRAKLVMEINETAFINAFRYLDEDHLGQLIGQVDELVQLVGQVEIRVKGMVKKK